MYDQDLERMKNEFTETVSVIVRIIGKTTLFLLNILLI